MYHNWVDKPVGHAHPALSRWLSGVCGSHFRLLRNLPTSCLAPASSTVSGAQTCGILVHAVCLLPQEQRGSLQPCQA